MKILAIRGLNLASLAGGFEIDFGQEPLASAGLFAICGPTGSGKSTLLDALCLALYDETPRLTRAAIKGVSLPDVGTETISPQDPRNLLRRGTGEAWAEVDFVGNDGLAYRARWSVRRARGRAGGKLQESEMWLQTLVEGQRLGGVKKEVKQEIEQRLGLSFSQFTRAVLLAQNDFAAFLKANDNERSELLETLTGLEIYSELSRRAFERAKAEQQALDELKRRLAGQSPLTLEARAGLEQRWADAKAEAAVLEERQSELEQQLRQQETWARLRQAEQESLEHLEQSLREQTAAAPRQSALDQVESARGGRPLIDTMDLISTDLENNRRELFSMEEQLTGAKRLRQEAEADLALARQAVAEAEGASALAAGDLNLAKALDPEIALLIPLHKAADQRLKAARQAETQATAAFAAAESALGLGNNDLQAATQVLAGCDAEALAEDRSRAERRREQLTTAERLWSALESASQRRQTLDIEAAALRGNITEAEAALSRLRAGKPPASARLEQAEQALKTAEAACAKNVETLRAHLEHGSPCPVCGAIDHPYASGEAPSRAILVGLKTQVDACRQALDALIKEEAGHEAGLATDDRRLAAIAAERHSLSEAIQRDADLWPAHPLAGEVSSMAPEKRGAWFVDQNRSLQARIAAITWEEQARRLAEKAAQGCQAAEEFARLDGELEDRRRQRQALFAGRPIPAVEAELAGAIVAARSRHQQQTQKAQQSAQEQARAETRLEQAHNQLAAAREAWNQAATALEDWIQRFNTEHPGLTLDEPQLRAWLARDETWIKQERETLRRLAEAVRDAQVTYRERRSQREALDREAPTRESAESLRAALEQTSAGLDRLQEQVMELEVWRRRDNEHRDQAAAIEAEIAIRETENRVWGQLNELIGSADGKKFRHYAQQFSLDVLLGYANRHLADLSRRYRLERVRDTLALMVVDQDMGDERRSVHSLSGGESFLVSLALALGLASLSSNRVRVESLFIDEGFGSLDADTLGVAMEALDRLQAQGRKVGVISHVPEMTERIGLQIQVRPHSGGRSRIQVCGG